MWVSGVFGNANAQHLYGPKANRNSHVQNAAETQPSVNSSGRGRATSLKMRLSGLGDAGSHPFGGALRLRTRPCPQMLVSMKP